MTAGTDKQFTSGIFTRDSTSDTSIILFHRLAAVVAAAASAAAMATVIQMGDAVSRLWR